MVPVRVHTATESVNVDKTLRTTYGVMSRRKKGNHVTIPIWVLLLFGFFLVVLALPATIFAYLAYNLGYMVRKEMQEGHVNQAKDLTVHASGFNQHVKDFHDSLVAYNATSAERFAALTSFVDTSILGVREAIAGVLEAQEKATDRLVELANDGASQYALQTKRLDNLITLLTNSLNERFSAVDRYQEQIYNGIFAVGVQTDTATKEELGKQTEALRDLLHQHFGDAITNKTSDHLAVMAGLDVLVANQAKQQEAMLQRFLQTHNLLVHISTLVQQAQQQQGFARKLEQAQPDHAALSSKAGPQGQLPAQTSVSHAATAPAAETMSSQLLQKMGDMLARVEKLNQQQIQAANVVPPPRPSKDYEDITDESVARSLYLAQHMHAGAGVDHGLAAFIRQQEEAARAGIAEADAAVSAAMQQANTPEQAAALLAGVALDSPTLPSVAQPQPPSI